MPTRQPLLGSLAIQAPPSPQTIRVSPSTCHNLSVFKGASRTISVSFQALRILSLYRYFKRVQAPR